jgi:FKBP-type peptidyl-prolyl cis-trans isomerase SlpA
MTQIVQPDSLLTLHYRISLDNGQPLISTFESTPATLQLGRGEMPRRWNAAWPASPRRAPHLPARARERLRPHRDELVEKRRAKTSPTGAEVEPMSHHGIHRARRRPLPRPGPRSARRPVALIDFNHPLAGKSIRFEVEVIGVN